MIDEKTLTKQLQKFSNGSSQEDFMVSAWVYWWEDKSGRHAKAGGI